MNPIRLRNRFPEGNAGSPITCVISNETGHSTSKYTNGNGSGLTFGEQGKMDWMI